MIHIDSLDVDVSIKWMENFKNLWTSTSVKKTMKKYFIDGDRKKEEWVQNTIILTLKPKKIWHFTIWPAIFSNWWDEKQTNTVSINVEAKSTIIEPIHSKVYQNPEKNLESQTKKNNLINILFIILFVLIILIFIIFFILFRNYSSTKIEKQDTKKSENKDEWGDEIVDLDKKNDDTSSNIPDTEDKDFVTKIEHLLRNNIWKKYNIKNIENYTFSEIWKQKLENKEKQDLEKIADLLNKIKYSNILVSKVKLLERVKKFIK